MDEFIEVVEEVVFGEPEEVLRLLGADSGDRINGVNPSEWTMS